MLSYFHIFFYPKPDSFPREAATDFGSIMFGPSSHESVYDPALSGPRVGGRGSSPPGGPGAARRGSKLSDAMEKKFRMGEKRGKRDKQGKLYSNAFFTTVCGSDNCVPTMLSSQ